MGGKNIVFVQLHRRLLKSMDKVGGGKSKLNKGAGEGAGVQTCAWGRGRGRVSRDEESLGAGLNVPSWELKGGEGGGRASAPERKKENAKPSSCSSFLVRFGDPRVDRPLSSPPPPPPPEEPFLYYEASFVVREGTRRPT